MDRELCGGAEGAPGLPNLRAFGESTEFFLQRASKLSNMQSLLYLRG
jgi:hypothetical protein